MCDADVIGKIVDSLKKSAIRNFLNPGNKYCKHKGEDSLQGALREAKIYDLSGEKAQVKKWTQLSNVRTYYEFFKKHEEEFE